MKDASFRESNSGSQQRSISDLSSHDMILRSAFEDSLMILGRAVQKVLITDLEARSLHSCDRDYFELSVVQDSLARFFGNNSAQYIIKRLLSPMNEIQSGATRS